MRLSIIVKKKKNYFASLKMCIILFILNFVAEELRIKCTLFVIYIIRARLFSLL